MEVRMADRSVLSDRGHDIRSFRANRRRILRSPVNARRLDFRHVHRLRFPTQGIPATEIVFLPVVGFDLASNLLLVEVSSALVPGQISLVHLGVVGKLEIPYRSFL